MDKRTKKDESLSKLIIGALTPFIILLVLILVTLFYTMKVSDLEDQIEGKDKQIEELNKTINNQNLAYDKLFLNKDTTILILNNKLNNK